MSAVKPSLRRRRSLPQTETGIPEENTLGIIVGRPARAVGGAARRMTRPGSPYRSSLGTAFLSIGAAVVVGLRAVYGGTVAAANAGEYTQPLIALAAWVVLVVTIAAMIVASRLTSDRLPPLAYTGVLLGLGAALVLDLVAVWERHDIGTTATAAPTAVLALILLVPVQGRSGVVAALSAGGALLALAMLVNTSPVDVRSATAQILMLAGSVLPVIIALALVEGYRHMVQVELDRVLVQSTVQAPRFAVGMLASEELARLDSTAEELFDNIASGKVNLPLSPRSASVAASLATELRLHLIEGRRETWLYHAISESEQMGKSVTLVDKSSLAGLLDPAQRDGLLSALWLLINETTRRATLARSIEVKVGPVVPTVGLPSHKISVPVVIVTSGIPRNRVDPSVWDSLARVGRYSDSTQDASLRLDIDCLVDNPADV